MPKKEVEELKKTVVNLEKVVGGLARQIMLQQFYVEERIRSEGSSGLKQIRLGLSNYNSETHNGYNGVAHIHNYQDHIGLGEFVGVLNGHEFRARHNDFRFNQPSKTTKNYEETEEISHPEVPPSVSSKTTVTEQITEMRKYFEAFHKQDKSIRNYEPYFKPVMCYLEGGWTTDTKTMSEPFQSWFDLEETVRYTSYTGDDSNNENYLFLPTTIINVTEHGEPVYAQWNYRILCHPIRTLLKLQDFQLVDDLASRMRSRKTFTAFGKTREARFRLTLNNLQNIDADLGYDELTGNSCGPTLLDKLMQEIPGKDNYQGHIQDNSFDLLKYRIDTKEITVLNAAYYHRFYKVHEKGVGLAARRRGFSDQNMFVALTTQNKIAELGAKDCSYDTNLHETVCHQYKSRITYAIPLEIIYMTPLNTWNPYKLSIHDTAHSSDVSEDGLNGGCDDAHAYNRTSTSAYYLTPVEFFYDEEVAGDTADTTRSYDVCILDQHGNVRKVAASGTRVFLPEIPGVGIIRQRYPIFPVHSEGSTTGKTLEALQDLMLHMKQYPYIVQDEPDISNSSAHPSDTTT